MGQSLVMEGGFLDQVLIQTTPMPLSAALDFFLHHARQAPVNNRLLSWGERVLAVPSHLLSDWHQRAWWGCCASFAIMGRLGQGRVGEIIPYIQQPDWSVLQQDQGRGTILVGAHVGPGLVASYLLQQVCPEVMIPATNNVVCQGGLVDLNRSYLQDRSMAMAALLLRRGGTLYLTVDGQKGSHPRPFPFMGGTVALQPTVPNLIRHTSCRVYWLTALWQEERIVLSLEPFPCHPEGNEGGWFEEYLARLAHYYRQDPRNLRLSGGIWNNAGGMAFPPPL